MVSHVGGACPGCVCLPGFRTVPDVLYHPGERCCAQGSPVGIRRCVYDLLVCITDRKAHGGMNEPSRQFSARPDTRYTSDPLICLPMLPALSCQIHGAVRLLAVVLTRVSCLPARDAFIKYLCAAAVKPVCAACLSYFAARVCCPAGWREPPPVQKSAAAGTSAGIRRRHSRGGHIHRERLRTARHETRKAFSGEVKDATHGGEREIEVRQNSGVSIRSRFCVSPES
jgi:hypothetical protein